MKVLFFSPDVPFPVRHGGHVRTFGLIQCLSRFATVRVLAIGDRRDAEDPGTRQAFEALGATIEAFPALGPEGRWGLREERPFGLRHYASPVLAQRVPTLVEAFAPDVAHFEEVVMAPYAAQVACPAVLDRQKVEWVYHREVRRFLRPTDVVSPASWLFALRDRLESSRFRRWEETLRGRFAAVLVLGEADRRLLSAVHGDRVHVVPNGVSPSIRLPNPRTSEVRFVLLYGSLDYPPNAEAHEHYLRRVWPALRAADPELTTRIAGHGVPLRPLPSDDPRVEVLGFVPEVMDVLGGPGVLVVALRVGGGIRNKILEALAAGMPVVSTGAGAEDLGLEEGRHYLRAESPEQMVEAVLRLKRSPDLVQSLGREGSRLVEERHRWGQVAQALAPIYRDAARAASRS